MLSKWGRGRRVITLRVSVTNVAEKPKYYTANSTRLRVPGHNGTPAIPTNRSTSSVITIIIGLDAWNRNDTRILPIRNL